EYIGIVVISGFLTTLFFGGWYGPVLPGIVWFMIKMAVFIVLFVLMRASMPRPRFDQLMSWGWKVLFPLVLVNLFATGAIVLWIQGG
ncbi:MAG: NADH-quinone oxidoreductase subunit H, partial [Bradymonadaceae bacterium]